MLNHQSLSESMTDQFHLFSLSLGPKQNGQSYRLFEITKWTENTPPDHLIIPPPARQPSLSPTCQILRRRKGHKLLWQQCWDFTWHPDLLLEFACKKSTPKNTYNGMLFSNLINSADRQSHTQRKQRTTKDQSANTHNVFRVSVFIFRFRLFFNSFVHIRSIQYLRVAFSAYIIGCCDFS